MWSSYCEKIKSLLDALAVTDSSQEAIDIDEGFSRWAAMGTSLRKAGTIHIIGNGASASMASHYAADITKNCQIRAVVFTDVALITAMGNDYGYENGFSIALERYAREGDLLVAISSSGNSLNIVKACQKAKEMNLDLVTVSGMRSDNRIRKLGALNFYVAAETYGLVESTHAVLLHRWTDLLENANKTIR